MTDENRQPVYTPPPAPGILPDGKRVFVCLDETDGVDADIPIMIIADSEVQARGMFEDAVALDRRPIGWTLVEIGPDSPYVLTQPVGHR